MIWKPNVTVAAVIEQNGRYLLVEEETSQGPAFNQPAGHLDPGESIIAGAIRETLEETACTFLPQSLLGIYQWHSATTDTTFLRFAFTGTVTGHDPARRLDDGIIRTVWFTPDEIAAMASHHRSPLVMQCILDHLAGKQYPLTLLTHYEQEK
jgi:8-oxo-dGTP pyrophosphatase MutT (NUDIX family)